MTKGKRGLGRGLEALLPHLEVREGEEVMALPLDDIDPNPYQPRRAFDEERLSELALSVREHGILQPIIVAPRQNRYQLVAGERRWRAARMAGLLAIPAVVRELSDELMMEVALIENIQRHDLNPIEEARAYRNLVDKLGVTQDELASRLGKSRSAVANSLRLLNLDQEIQSWVESGSLSMGHARALLALNNPSQQRQLGKKIIDEGLNVRQTEVLVRPPARRGKVSRASRGAPPTRSGADFATIEDALRLALGARVRIQHSPRRGSLVIEYYGIEDLERIIERITGAPLNL